MLIEYFPDTVLIISLGNNDYKYHYQTPSELYKQDYYSFLFDQYFLQHPKNSKLPELETIKKTFMKGGYFRVDISDNLSVLSMNTLMYNIRSEENF